MSFVDTQAAANQRRYQWRSGGGLFRMSLVNDTDGGFVQQNILVANASGNVGFGTASPEAKMDVRVTSLAAGANTALWSPSGTPDVNTSYVHYGATGDWYIRPGTAGGRAVVADNGGAVGIGTSARTTPTSWTSSARPT
jgi:hypothetical protein